MADCFTIYCVTNTVNGKRYVGQTCGTVEVRWKAHVASAKRHEGCRVLGAAIRKYGASAFVRSVLEVVASQADADTAEAKWIVERQSRSPKGYNLAAGGGGNGLHHEESKRLISAASKKRMAEMTPEQRVAYFSTNIRVWTPERRSRQRARAASDRVRENVRAGQKKFWSKFTAEEKTERVLHQLAGMSAAEKSERVRKAWADMPPEARAARVRKTALASTSAKAAPAHSKKMSERQTAQAKLRTPEQRQAMVLKSWETRRAKYGKGGHSKPSEAFSAATRRGWANMTSEARAERVRKVQAGRLRAREARNARMIRINLFPSVPA